MLRRLLACLLLAPLVAAHAPVRHVAQPASRDWTRTVTRDAAGEVVIGNPAARLKLVEYVSYTCPPCAAVTAESAAVVRGRWVRSGQVSVAIHPAVREPLDLAAAMLARCSGARFGAVHDAIYAGQTAWYGKGAEYIQANIAQLNAQPILPRLRALADGAGLTAIAQTAGGLTPRAVIACFASDADMNRIVALTDEALKVIEGTPSFALNGKFLGNGTWATLEPQLRAAGAH